MRHGSLFSGIGGFDLASEWMGWENIFHCEWMPFPQKILKHYWPNAISYEDITKTDFTIHRGSIDILTGGFPCQPYSMAGKRLGKEDERHLWPEMLRAIKEIQPTWVVGENVYGLTNWNGGMVFEEVCVDLENCGYEIQPIVLPACSVNAPHRRDRVWFVAANTSCIGRNKNEWRRNGESNEFNEIGKGGTTTDPDSIRLEECKDGGKVEGRQSQVGRKGCQFTNATKTISKISDATYADHLRFNGCLGQDEIDPSKRGIDALNDTEPIDERNIAHTYGKRLQRCLCSYEHKQQRGQEINAQKHISTYTRKISFEEFPTQSPVCGGDDGISTQLDGITFSKWRQESIKGYGNAVVPQLVYEIFKVIEQMHNNSTGIFPNHSTNS